MSRKLLTLTAIALLFTGSAALAVPHHQPHGSVTHPRVYQHHRLGSSFAIVGAPNPETIGNFPETYKKFGFGPAGFHVGDPLWWHHHHHDWAYWALVGGKAGWYDDRHFFHTFDRHDHEHGFFHGPEPHRK